MKRLIGMMQFMTRLPLPFDVGFDDAFHKGMIYFPIVGAVLGLIYYVVGKVSLMLFDPYMTAVILVTAMVLCTGGLHLDGLGDTFDGLYSYRDKDRILEIMKDSRLGTNALLAIMLVLLLKVGVIQVLIQEGKLWSVGLMPVVARTMQVVACYRTKTPRPQGMGNLFIGKVSTPYLVGTLLIMGVLVSGLVFIIEGVEVTHGLIQLGTVSVLMIGTRLFVASVYQKIEGITGDVLGCICELVELVYLVSIYIGYSLLG